MADVPPTTVPALKVVDFSTHFSGSVASRFLSHFGAEVVKVEHPTLGDGNRSNVPLIHGESAAHIALNVGKKSVTVDRRSPEWPETLRRLVEWADVVVYGAVPSAAERRGLDFASLSALNANLVHCLVTGYGEVGPWRDLPSHGLNTDVYAGLVPVEQDGADARPSDAYRSVGTTLAGIYAAMGILEAVRRRDAGAGAQRVSVSVWHAALSWQWRDLVTEANLGRPMDAYGDLGTRYAIYPTADDRLILVCPIEEKFWVSFCDVVGLGEEHRARGDWSTGADYGQGYDDERVAIRDRMRTATLDEWVARFDEVGLPFAPFLTLGEALATDQAELTRMMALTSVGGQDVVVPNIPIGISGEADAEATLPPVRLDPPPVLGAHTDEVLAQLRLREGGEPQS